jgi:hypothetical protein
MSGSASGRGGALSAGQALTHDNLSLMDRVRPHEAERHAEVKFGQAYVDPCMGRETWRSPMSTNSKPAISRRTVFAGAGAVGAVGAIAAAASLPGLAPAPEKTAEARADTSGGYQLTDHVKRYYATARL